jgi:DmsE family decaheme c-type cytochrome
MRKRFLFVLPLALLLVAGASIASASQEAQQSPPPVAGHPVVSFDVTDCKTCHPATVFGKFERSHHSELANSCSNCHGDVATHAKSEMGSEGKGPIISLRSATAAVVNAQCLACHDKRRQANWSGGMHDRRGLACTTCHSIHDFKSTRAQLKTERDSETCFTCHQAIRAQTMRTSHHPIREGKMDCANCHDPHDSTRPKMVSAESVIEKCYSCHTEKRGPFLWEHAPVRDNCMLCHNPHGSNHASLLVAKPPYLCQRCHLNTRHPGTLYDFRNTAQGSNPTNRDVSRACVNCHANIHGSNAPSGNYLGR